MLQKRWSFGFGTIFSLIVVYFIFLYSKDKGWALLAFISKWYLIIIGGLIALSLGIILLIVSFALLIFLISMFKLRNLDKKFFWKNFKKGAKQSKQKGYIDVEYKVKE